MAELICTDEEKAAASYLDWDDASLGRACKKIALMINDDNGGRDARQVMAGAVFFLSKAVEIGSVFSSVAMEGLHDGKKEIGDWLITAQRINFQAWQADPMRDLCDEVLNHAVDSAGWWDSDDPDGGPAVAIALAKCYRSLHSGEDSLLQAAIDELRAKCVRLAERAGCERRLENGKGGCVPTCEACAVIMEDYEREHSGG